MRISKNIFFIFIILIFSFCSSILAADMDTSKFYEAGIAYKAGDYDKAIKIYEDIIAQGKVSGALYYNLGNSYFKKGDLGRTILNYERARLLIPMDSDLRSNYNYVLNLVKDNPQKRGFWANIINKYSRDFTLDDLASINLFLFIILGVILFLGLFLNWRKKFLVIAVSVLSFFVIFNLGVIYHMDSVLKKQAIVVSDSDAKFEPTEDSTTHFKARNGMKVVVLDKDEDWVKIKRRDGKMGWIMQDTVEKIL